MNDLELARVAFHSGLAAMTLVLWILGLVNSINRKYKLVSPSQEVITLAILTLSVFILLGVTTVNYLVELGASTLPWK